MSIPVPLEGFGGGGAALNFKVVPGLTQPGTATENTIWVKTEKITGWYFSATQPENMQEWEVWFPTGASSEMEFNALKKNAIQVYLLSAQQYVNGEMVDLDGAIYLNGAWINWEAEKPGLYWFEKGVLNGDLGKSTEVGTSNWYTFSDTEGYFEHRVPANNTGYMRTYSMLDVTNYKSIVLKCEEQSGGTLEVGLSNNSSISDIVASGEKNTTGAGKITVDIEFLTGSYYLFYKGKNASSDSNVTAKITDIYLV